MPEQDQAPRPLTLAFVRHVVTPGRYYDCDGLILTVTPSGGKSWTQRLTVQGRRRDIGLGSAHVVTPAEARRRAARNKAIARTGGNPLATGTLRPEQAAGEGRAVTFAGFSANRFRRLRAVPGGAKAAAETYRRVRLHANPRIGRRPIAAITEDEIAEMLLEVAAASRSTARWLRQALGPIFEEAVAEGLRDASPVRTLQVAGLAQLEPARVAKVDLGLRALERLPAFLQEIEADTRRQASFLLIRFCLLTSRSPKECRLAIWPQINLAARTWVFPAMQTPGKREVRIDLHDGHLAILRQARGRAVGEDGYIFPSRQGVDEPFVDESISMSLRRAGYKLVPRDFLRAHKVWVEQEGGMEGDLLAWWERLRQEPLDPG